MIVWQHIFGPLICAWIETVWHQERVTLNNASDCRTNKDILDHNLNLHCFALISPIVR